MTRSSPIGDGYAALSLKEAEAWPTRQVATSLVRYKGRRALRVVGTAGDDIVDKLVVLPVALRDGVIEVEAAGMPEPGQPPDARSYFGIAFRSSADLSLFEAMYVRPENSGSDDQLRRNRSTQYVAFPDRPWQKLRSETPGRYESHVDLAPGEWTRLRVELKGRTAKLYVNGASSPALVVTDLLPSDSNRTGVGLWIGNRTIAYFAAIRSRGD